MREFLVDLSAVRSWPGLVAAFNEGFMRHIGGDWNGNLDAFHDYLSWPDLPYRLVIEGWSSCRTQVNGYKTRDGRLTLDVIEEIFRDNPQAEIVLD